MSGLQYFPSEKQPKRPAAVSLMQKRLASYRFFQVLNLPPVCQLQSKRGTTPVWQKPQKLLLKWGDLVSHTPLKMSEWAMTQDVGFCVPTQQSCWSRLTFAQQPPKGHMSISYKKAGLSAADSTWKFLQPLQFASLEHTEISPEDLTGLLCFWYCHPGHQQPL